MYICIYIHIRISGRRSRKFKLYMDKFARPLALGVSDPELQPCSLRSFSALLALAKSLGGGRTLAHSPIRGYQGLSSEPANIHIPL